MLIYLLVFAICIVASIFGRSRYALLFLIVVISVFVGLRYETGFDWPVYKAEWAHLFHQVDIGNIVRYQARYHEEVGFLGLLAALTWVFPQYEYAQFALSLALVFSTIYLVRTFKVSNATLCLTIIVSYLLFSLFFSVVRQALAISVFNAGLALYLRDRRRLGVVAIIASVAFQYTAAVYLFAFFGALAGKRYAPPASLRRWVLIIGVACLAGEAIFFVLGRYLQAYLPERFATYVNLPLGLDLWSLEMFIAFSVMAVHSSWPSKDANLEDEKYNDFRRVLVVLGGITAGSTLIPILRERAAYEFWILYAIYLCMAGTFLRRAAISFALAFGVYCSAVLFKYPTSLMLVPYQNFAVSRVLGLQSTAEDRYNTFITLVTDRLASAQGNLLPTYGAGVSHGRSERPGTSEHHLVRK